MGVLNVTPDSFSDGGRFVDEGVATEHARRMIADGAEIIDVGAESTRPRALPIAPREQIQRIGRVVRKIVELGALVSIDTTSVEVARWALDEGASIVNSVELAPAKELGALAKERDVALVLMHSRGPMRDMPGFSTLADDAYGDVVKDVAREWKSAANAALAAGVHAFDLVHDPGLGFWKNARHSLELCARLDELVALGHPVLVGPSRKSFVARAAAGDRGELAPPGDRLGGTIAATLACVARGASIVRVHDVAEVKQALAVARAIDRAAAPRRPPREEVARV